MVVPALEVESLRQRHRPACWNAYALGEASRGAHTQIETDYDHRIAGRKGSITALEYDPCSIDARRMRKVARYAGIAVRRQRIFVVQGGKTDVNQQISSREFIRRSFHYRAGKTVAIATHLVGLECRHRNLLCLSPTDAFRCRGCRP